MTQRVVPVTTMLVGLALLVANPGRSAALVGDCGNDGEVTIEEVTLIVNIALGNQPASACPPGDSDGDGDITIDEVVAAVGIALNGPPPTASLTPTPTRGGTANAHVDCAADRGAAADAAPSSTGLYVGMAKRDIHVRSTAPSISAATAFGGTRKSDRHTGADLRARLRDLRRHAHGGVCRKRDAGLVCRLQEGAVGAHRRAQDRRNGHRGTDSGRPHRHQLGSQPFRARHQRRVRRPAQLRTWPSSRTRRSARSSTPGRRCVRHSCVSGRSMPASICTASSASRRTIKWTRSCACWSPPTPTTPPSVQAVMINYAAHATIMGSDNLKVSSDWPGVAATKVEQALGIDTALWCHGGRRRPHATQRRRGCRPICRSSMTMPRRSPPRFSPPLPPPSR